MGTHSKRIVGDFGKEVNLASVEDDWVQAIMFVPRYMASGEGAYSRLDLVQCDGHCSFRNCWFETNFSVEGN